MASTAVAGVAVVEATGGGVDGDLVSFQGSEGVVGGGSDGDSVGHCVERLVSVAVGEAMGGGIDRDAMGLRGGEASDGRNNNSGCHAGNGGGASGDAAGLRGDSGAEGKADRGMGVDLGHLGDARGEMMPPLI